MVAGSEQKLVVEMVGSLVEMTVVLLAVKMVGLKVDLKVGRLAVWKVENLAAMLGRRTVDQKVALKVVQMADQMVMMMAV